MIAFSRAVTGLRIAEQNLYVTSNNLSNVETEGYHRQRLNQYAFQTTSRGNFAVGLGVDADSIRQTRLEFLETNYRNELASYGEYKYEDKVYTSLQSIIGDDGSYVQDCLKDMWESFNELAKEYTTTIAGSYLRENAVSLIAEFDSINQQLDKMQSELDTEILNVVRKINDYTSQIAELNDQINRSEADGSLACELRDSRDSIIASLSELIDIQVENVTNTCVNIRTANGYLVVRTDANRLTAAKITPQSTFHSPIWETTGEPLEVTSGELKGIIDMRGGNVVGNLEHSSNGAPKEKMDIVVSIDTKMDYGTVQNMAKNLKNMIDIFDRQSVNYQLYLTTGELVSGDDLKAYANHIYLKDTKDEINNSGATSITQLQQYVQTTYGKEAKLGDDIWAYVNKQYDIDSFEQYLQDQNIDSELVKQYKAEDGKTLQGFLEFLKSSESVDEAADLEQHVNDYIDTLSIDDMVTYLEGEYAIDADVLAKMEAANSDNVLENVTGATIIDFTSDRNRLNDSNKYMMVFTDDKVSQDVLPQDVAARLNGIDMDLIAVTNEESKSSWRALVDETSGSVFDIAELGTEDGTENLGLSITRDFNSRLIGVDEEGGIAFFRSSLNSLLNGLVREINGVLRQGENGYHKRHGDEYINPETGETEKYNLDLFLKIDDKLPLQMGNIKINPLYEDVMNMPLSLSGDTGDFQIGNMLVDLTTADVFNSRDSYSTFDEHYANFILDFGQAANRAFTGCETQTTVLTTAKDRIAQVSGVSMDEELSNMIKFQYSYTAASKMIRLVDEMLETVINI